MLIAFALKTVTPDVGSSSVSRISRRVSAWWDFSRVRDRVSNAVDETAPPTRP